MQIRKLDWINRPDHVRLSAHSVEFTDEKHTACLHTTGENENIRLSCEGDGICFLMLHTDRDRLVLGNGKASFSFAGFSYEIPLDVPSCLIVRKQGADIRFEAEDGRLLMHLTNPAFLGSASFGFATSGSGGKAVLRFSSL